MNSTTPLVSRQSASPFVSQSFALVTSKMRRHDFEMTSVTLENNRADEKKREEYEEKAYDGPVAGPWVAGCHQK